MPHPLEFPQQEPLRVFLREAESIDAIRVAQEARDELLHLLATATTLSECFQIRAIANNLARTFENLEDAALRKADGI